MLSTLPMLCIKRFVLVIDVYIYMVTEIKMEHFISMYIICIVYITHMQKAN